MVHVVFDGGDLRFESFYQSGEGVGSAYFEGLPIIQQRGYGYFSGYPLVYQRGNGLGDIFRSIYRVLKPMALKIGQALVPMAKDAGAAIGKEGIATSARVLNDIVQGKDAKSALMDEGKEGMRVLLDKANTTLQQKLQKGTGRKRRRKGMGSHILLKPNNLEGRDVKLKRPLNATSAKLLPPNVSKKMRKDTLGYY